MVFTNREAVIKVEGSAIKIPDDFGKLGMISYRTKRNTGMLAAVYLMGNEYIQLKFWDEDDIPETVTMDYFDIEMLKRNMEFLNLPSTRLTKGVWERFANSPSPFEYYKNIWKPNEPKMAQQDFERLFNQFINER